MKKFWKALGIAALAAAAVPVRIKKDEITGKKKYQSLLLSVDIGPGENGEGTDIGINIGEGGVIGSAVTNLMTAKKESELFADDEPEAAVLDAEELQVLTDEAQEADDEAPAIADEAEEATEADGADDHDPEL